MDTVVMPSSPVGLCRDCNSRALEGRRYCRVHAINADDEITRQIRNDANRADDSIRRLYKVKRWRLGTRLQVLRRDPLCVLCGHHASKVADHFPVGARELVAMIGISAFYDASRCRGLCTS